MNIVKFSIKRPVTTMMIIISMIILGFLTLKNLKTQLMPNSNFPTARISVRWSGASPDDMENLVTKVIEKGIASVEGITRITTQSMMERSTIAVEFEYGVDISSKVNDINTAVSKIRNKLPDDIDNPVISKSSFSSDRVMLISLAGPDLVSLKIFADNIIIPRFERIDGVGDINIDGGREREIAISIDPNLLEAHGIHISDLYSKLKRASLNFPAGYIREGGKEYIVRVFGEIKSLEDVQNIVITNLNGKTLYLKDIAHVRLDVKDVTSFGRTGGSPNILIYVDKTDSGNTADISKILRREIKSLESLLPADAKFTIIRDTAIDIENSINAVKNNALLGLILAILILLFFLKDVRATFVVAMAIPVSIIATFGFFGVKNITLNVMSLMGLSLGVGMLVDNSVVVLDNIFRHLTELDKDRVQASDDGASEVIVPIIASTATTVAVFFPVVLRDGRAKEIFQDMSYAIIFSLLSSLIVALTFVPMVCSKILKDRNRVHDDGKFLNFLKKHYTSFLKKALQFKKTTIGIVIALFIIFVVIGGKKIGGNFLPRVDDGVYSVIAELPSGLDVNKGNEIALEMEKIIATIPSTKSYTTSVNKYTISTIVDIGYRNKRKDKRPVFQIMNDTRRKLSHIPDIRLNVVPQMNFGRNVNKDMTLLLKSNNLDQMKIITTQIIDRMNNISGFADISSTIINGNPEARIILDREKLENQGIDISDLTMSVSYQILGGAPIKIKTINEEIDVTLQLDKKYRENLELLMDTRVKTKNGDFLKLRDVATLSIVEGILSIDKEDKIGTVSIKANIRDGMDLKTAQENIIKILDEIGLPRNISYDFGGDGRSMAEVGGQLGFALIIALFLIYFILAAQFESYILPIIVMGTVPLAIIGVYMGLFLLGEKTNIMVFIGIIMLFGIVVNNAIVLIDYFKILLDSGKSIDETLIEGGSTRLRPILMTTATTVFGMLPLALGIGQGSERYKGLAIAVIFGLSFSTLLTLIIIPIFYNIYYNLSQKFQSKFSNLFN